MTLLHRALASLLVLCTGSLVLVTPSASAATPVPATSLGYDVSFPQCGKPLPNGAGFGVVGVNNGHPFSINPCLSAELRWSLGTQSGAPQFYVNTANPGPSGNAQWPSGQQTPQICAGANSAACSFDYGWNAAQASFQAVVTAETAIGSIAPASAATGAGWWLDVETGNFWETLRTGSAPTLAQFTNDAAEVSGELAYLRSVQVQSVGIYSTSYQWGKIIGGAGAALNGVKVWLPGFATIAAAQAGCSTTSFTGGRVAMIQYPSNSLDGDYLCGLVSVPASASLNVPSTTAFSQQLSVTGESAAVTYAQTSGTPSLLVSPTGLVTTGGTLAPGVYVASGTTTSTDGLSGVYTFTVTVGQLTQVSTSTFSVTVPASVSFSSQVSVSGAAGPLLFTQSSGTPDLVVSPSGLVTATAVLAQGDYSAAGTVTDSFGDSGTYSLDLTVGALSQGAPLRVSVPVTSSGTFSDQMDFTGGAGPLTFVQTRGLPSLVVSPSGLITTSGTLTAGSYVVRGTVGDGLGDDGTFFFNLLVKAATITQSSPTSLTVKSTSLTGFSTQLSVTGAAGTPTFTQSQGQPSLVVSASGQVTAATSLGAGTYSAQGTVSDAAGDAGTFTFSLVVTAPPVVSHKPVARRVIGHAVAGRTVTLRIVGRGFFGRPTIVGPSGTKAIVLRDNGHRLVVRVRVARGSPRGVHVFVIALPNGKVLSVRYVQR